MKNILTSLLFVLVLVLSMSAVFGSFSVSVEPVTDSSAQIYKDEVAEFYVTIRNLQNVDDVFSIFTLNPLWTWNPSVRGIPAQSSETFLFRVAPTQSIQNSGFYDISFTTQSRNTRDAKTFNTEILIKSDSHRQFQPAIRISTPRLGEDGVIDPRFPFDVRVRLENLNALSIPSLKVLVSSSHFEDYFEAPISPNSELIRYVPFTINPYTPPSVDTLTIRLYLDGILLFRNDFEYEIRENRLLFERDSSLSKKKFLFNTYHVILENKGNVDSSEVFSYPIGRFAHMFTRTNVPSEFVITESGSELVFDVSLTPSEVTEIVIITDYRATFYSILSLLILIVVVLVLYFTLRSPILVTKKAAIVAEKDGGTQEIKILLNIRNRTNKNLENISVVDRIPDITEIEKEVSLGTLMPSKVIRHAKKGTLIKWNFPSIEGFEERIITYKIHSKLGILGGFELPSCIVKFDTPNGTSRAVKSKAIEKSE